MDPRNKSHLHKEQHFRPMKQIASIEEQDTWNNILHSWNKSHLQEEYITSTRGTTF
jgi:hypothetical protein